MKRLVPILLLFVSAALFAADDLAVARRALGDGLWGLAAKHAVAAANAATSSVVRAEARLMQLEALAGAGRAGDMLSMLGSWPDATGEGFRYWRAWANAADGKAAAARALLAEPFAGKPYAALALRLAARVEAEAGSAAAADAAYARAAAALAGDLMSRAENAVEWARFKWSGGDAAGALALLRKEGAPSVPGPVGDEARILEADLAAAAGDAAGARKIRESLVAGGTNTSERAYVLASCALSESMLASGAVEDAVAAASNAVARARHPDLARHAGFALGFARFASPAGRTAGVEQIAALVRRHPDAPESAAAQRRLADGLLAAGDAEAAVREYDVLLQAFPAHALDAHVLEGRGWAFLRLGRNSEAVGLFARAAQVASNEVDKARCTFKQADALFAGGRFDEAAGVYASVPAGALREKAAFRSADALTRAKKNADAAEAFRAIQKAGGELAVEAGLRLAALEVVLGHVEDAVAVYRALLDEAAVRRPTPEQRVRALAGRGRALYRAYRFPDAEADFAAVGKLDASRRDEMDFLIVLCQYGAGRVREASSSARALLARMADSPLRVDLRMWLATYDAGRREWPAAIAGFEACATNAHVSAARRVEAFVRAARCAVELPDFQKALELAVGASTNAVAGAEKAASGADGSASPSSEAAWAAEALVLQGEALCELGRFEDAEFVLERAARANGGEAMQHRAALAQANCYFVMGAGDAKRYQSAIDAYGMIQKDESYSPSQRLAASYNMARALEKLRRLDEAADVYYTNVVLAYWDGVRPDGSPGAENAPRVWFDSSARQYFSRAVYNLADHYESRGELQQAARMLEYIVRASLPAKDEARRRIARLKEKGGFK